MDQEQFVLVLKQRTSDAAAQQMLSRLRHAPGREPSSDDVAASEWFKQLPKQGSTTVEYIIREATELAVFSFFSTLDSLGLAIPDEEGIIELAYIGRGARTRLNDPDREALHDIYNWHLQNPSCSETRRK